MRLFSDIAESTMPSCMNSPFALLGTYFINFARTCREAVQIAKGVLYHQRDSERKHMAAYPVNVVRLRYDRRDRPL